MEGQQQLLSEETTGYKGIEAPNLIRKDITSNEVESTEQDVKLNEEKNIILNGEEASSSETKQDGEIHVKIEPEDHAQEEKKSNNEDGDTAIGNNDKDSSSESQTKADECTAVEDDAARNDQQTSEEKELETNDSEKTKNTKTEVKAKEETKKGKEEAEEKVRNGNHDEVVVDDGNNNEKRTRFSSEITIQPKAYFRAGTETVVTMSPGSTSDDVFKNESCEPTDSVLPRTFLPLTVFTCLFCPMIGLFAIYKSYSVKQFIKKGEIRRAREASQHARQLGILTLAIGFFFVLAIITIAILVSTLT